MQYSHFSILIYVIVSAAYAAHPFSSRKITNRDLIKIFYGGIMDLHDFRSDYQRLQKCCNSLAELVFGVARADI